MIYKINHGTTQKKLVQFGIYCFVNKGQVRRHRYNQKAGWNAYVAVFMKRYLRGEILKQVR